MTWLRKLLSKDVASQEEDFFTPSTDDETPIMLGRYASSLLKNPALDAAFKRIESSMFDAWKRSAPKDEVAREHLYYRMEALAQIKLKLQGMVQNMILEENKKKEK